jgi:hypothetical protein
VKKLILFALLALPVITRAADLYAQQASARDELRLQCPQIMINGRSDPRFRQCIEIMLQDQQEAIEYLEKPMEERAADSLKMQGREVGWPPASAFARYGFSLGQPNDLGVPLILSWETQDRDGQGTGPILIIRMEKKYDMMAGTFKPEDMGFTNEIFKKLDRHTQGAAGGRVNRYNYGYEYYKLLYQRNDPRRPHSSSADYYIETVLEWYGNSITITIRPVAFEKGG